VLVVTPLVAADLSEVADVKPLAMKVYGIRSVERKGDNTLGANPLGLSWITGLGERTIRCPLHNSRYRPEGLPVDGLQAEWPNARFAGYSYKDTAYPRCTERFAILNEFADVHFAIAMDEPIVNNMANTMMVFGLLAK